MVVVVVSISKEEGVGESSRDIIAGHVLTACNCVNNIQLIQLQPLPENGIKLRHNKEPDTIPFFFFFFFFGFPPWSQFRGVCTWV